MSIAHPEQVAREICRAFSHRARTGATAEGALILLLDPAEVDAAISVAIRRKWLVRRGGEYELAGPLPDSARSRRRKKRVSPL